MAPDPHSTQAASRLPDGLQLVAMLSTDGRVLRWVDDPLVLRAEWATPGARAASGGRGAPGVG